MSEANESGLFQQTAMQLENEDYKKSAFYLHQATENLYVCNILVTTGYKPKTHDLKKLSRLCSVSLNDFLTIFPLATKEQKDCFNLLRRACIEARYNKHYTITKEQLEYLITRVEKLRDLVEAACRDKT